MDAIEASRKEIAYIGGALNAMANQYVKNVHSTIIWGEKIRQLGYAVFIPGMDFLLGVVMGTLSYEDVFNNSQSFLRVASVMFICPGWNESKGTAKELIVARHYNIPIFFEQEGYDLLKWQRDNDFEATITKTCKWCRFFRPEVAMKCSLFGTRRVINDTKACYNFKIKDSIEKKTNPNFRMRN